MPSSLHNLATLVSLSFIGPVGNPKGYTQGDKESQEVAETCTRLIKNGIICWNYLYLEQKLAKAKTHEEREDMLAAVATHSVIAWAHINLVGEYDFSDEKLKDSVRILPPKWRCGTDSC